ncbi:MAG: hypothetical protein AAF449_11005, partial [Myxococcota bacterium]
RMKRAIDLLGAVAGPGASPEAARWAAAITAANAATPEVADALARSITPPSGSSLAWTTATFAGISAAGAATARAIAVMNEAPGADPWLPWWIPLTVCVPALIVIVASRSQARADARTASLRAAASLGLELINCGVPASLAAGIAAYLYELEPQDEQRFTATEAPNQLDERQRIAMNLAVLAGQQTPDRGPLALTMLAAGMLFIVFIFFLLTYLGLLEGGLSILRNIASS